ncbi:hypothetical protein ARC20_03610 [Stenotrophomonas panacihumi]|uniref:Uncharacterized protein n=1 Tax=Stenotrophomonas panacihumi TaxID=676599 RepID=A0A0R0ANX3_9GAMM|nr:hypothetical protein ARC20_03610 [Stenotrophomonas panacihumi]PTN54222.1 tetratricopeptide repeat protein [Stenotrophomonas panacihumi]
MLALVVATPAAAQQLVKTHLDAPRDAPAIGQQYRETVTTAIRQMSGGEPQAAIATLAPAVAYCDAQQARPNLRFVSVSTAAQYNRYAAGNTDGAPLEWLDMACTHAYYYTGYALVEQRAFAEALPYLEKAAALAPYYPDAPNERGLALNLMGRNDEAEQQYRQVLALAEAAPEAAYVVPLTWRGIGYALIEKRDWAGARAAYEHSLALDPGNKTALNELEYIKQHAAP